MILLVGVAAAVLIGFYIRARLYRARFNRALEAMSKGGLAQRAKVAFWKIVGLCVLVGSVWLYVKAHAR